MPGFVIDLGSSEEAHPAQVGGKGAALCRLARAGFPVPPGFVITTQAFRAGTDDGLLLGCRTAEEASARIAGALLPDRLVAEVLLAYRRLAAHSRFVAVRSSATTEDAAAGSMAGLGLTVLGVAGPEALFAAVRQVWASVFRQQALVYEPAPLPLGSRTLSLSSPPPEMAVVVQALVEPDAAGVLFTVNPVTLEADEAVLQAAYGLGQSVVDGGAADTFLLDRQGRRVRESRVARKVERVVATADGIARSPVGEGAATLPAIDAARALALLDLGERIERFAGGPQDIEWAIAHGQVWVLQTRPIASLARQSGERVLWSNANVGESLPGVPSPLTWSIIGDYARRGFVDAFGGLGLEVPDGYDFVGSVRGRVYLNLSQFLEVIGQIPFLSPRTLLALAGVSASEVPAVPRRGRISPALFLARLPLSAARFTVNHFAAPRRARRTARSFGEWRDRLLATELDAQPLPALGDALGQVHELLADRGGLLLTVSSNFLASWVACREILRLAGSNAAEDDLGALFSGLGGVVSAEPGLGLLDLAHVARAEADAGLAIAEGLEGEALRARLAATEGGRRFAVSLDGFLARYGLRAAREAEISTPRWRDDPSFVLEVVRLHLEAPTLPTAAERQAARERLRAEATRRVLDSLPRVTRALFNRLLAHAQSAGRLREELRTQVIEILGLYRHVFLGVGRRLVDERRASTPEDVFHLTLGEVDAWLAGAPPEALPFRIAYRRAKSLALEAGPAPPEAFVVGAGEPAPMSTPTATASGPELRGLPASPGRALGRVRIVRDPHHAPLRHGEVLVAPAADAGWTPLFLVAAAVVLETGGPLSHACVVAREMGVPVVTGVAHATTRLRDGDLVAVDAHTGVVQPMVARRRAASSTAPVAAEPGDEAIADVAPGRR